MEREETVEEGEEIERERKGRVRRLGGKNKNGKMGNLKKILLLSYC